ncbi:MAG TPA: hypothetical protein VJT54_10770 [Verrucomicrobiae bacterium]|nr:hypothetical protein [Verrucomicrobiae bacterium]
MRVKLKTRGIPPGTGSRLASLLAAGCVFAGAFIAPANRVAAVELWLSSTNSLGYLGQHTNFGSGTQLNPYYGDFDYIMANRIPASTIVHLGEGVFWTKANFGYQIPAGITLSGEGESFTTVRRATNFPGYAQQIYCILHSAYSNITVCNLTLDNNAFDCFANGWTNAVLGVALLGSGETIQHVTDVNGYGKAFGFSPEGFQLSVGNFGQHDNKVIGCTVSNFIGLYGDGIAAVGDCVVEGNYIYFPVLPAGQPSPWQFGINVVASSRGSLIIGNHVYGGADGFHNDTAGDTNLVIADNVFENVCQGVYLSGVAGPYNSVIISHNLMTQITNYPAYHSEMFLVDIDTYYPGETNLNITVDGNILRYYQNVPFTSDGLQGAIHIAANLNKSNQNNENISIINNQIDARMPVEITDPISNLYASGNIPLNGTNFATFNGYPGLTNFVPDP